MNPREQACAAVKTAKERRDTRLEHAATKRAKEITHGILRDPPKPQSARDHRAFTLRFWAQIWAQVRGRS